MLFLTCVAAAALASPAPAHKETLLQAIAGSPKHKTLLSALVLTGLDEALKLDGDLTVFAPTDEAFARLPEGTLNKLLQPQNKKELRSLLPYQVLKGRRTAAELLAEGGAVPLERPGGVVVSDRSRVVWVASAR
jgi:uncharacterized surface protein with fasciclin (FAS1) repeats